MCCSVQYHVLLTIVYIDGVVKYSPFSHIYLSISFMLGFNPCIFELWNFWFVFKCLYELWSLTKLCNPKFAVSLTVFEIRFEVVLILKNKKFGKLGKNLKNFTIFWKFLKISSWDLGLCVWFQIFVCFALSLTVSECTAVNCNNYLKCNTL